VVRVTGGRLRDELQSALVVGIIEETIRIL
jgi:hypothetical protein